MEDANPTLRIKNLTVAYRQGKQWLEAVRDFSLQINSGQTYGLVGESGSGKSTVALAIMRHLSQNGQVQDGEILFENRDMLKLSTADMRQVWGGQMAMVPQDPLSSLNPSLRIGEQIAEILRQHGGLSRKEARSRSVELLRMVRVPDPERVEHSYPHEISGGMQQRALIAMALSTKPRLLVLDEPTTGLDVTTQAAVLDLFHDLIEGRQTAALYVTHNLGVVARICQRVAVLYAGELVEDAPVEELFLQPWHPYTMGLLESVPQIGQSKLHVELQAIPGQIPSLQNRPSGCVFAPRCALAIDRCHVEKPRLDIPVDGRRVRCFRWSEIAAGDISLNGETANRKYLQIRELNEQVLEIDNLQVYFEFGRSFTNVVKRQPGQIVKAVDGVGFRLDKGQTLGIVGESGSGKTTLARAIVGLAIRTGGEINLLGSNLPPELNKRPVETRKLLQYVFQNPEEALNPYMTIGETLRRPYISLLNKSREESDAEVVNLLQAVRLPTEYSKRMPSQLSGGEKQRIAIARAFATHPDLLITDEPVSALDVSVQASILNLLRDLQADNNNTLIFISHDLAVVGYVADLIAVMYVGQIMELATSKSLFQPPHHPYTEALLSAIPLLDPLAQQAPIRLQGDVPSQVDLPSGCPFHPRCPRYLGDICKTETPHWQENEIGQRIFCHIPLEDLMIAQYPIESGQKAGD
jgi:peptide/nickel transport system ATP-binding protein